MDNRKDEAEASRNMPEGIVRIEQRIKNPRSSHLLHLRLGKWAAY